MIVVSHPPPVAFLVFHLSDWGEACATSAAVGGGAPGPVPQERGTGRGRPARHASKARRAGFPRAQLRLK